MGREQATPSVVHQRVGEQTSWLWKRAHRYRYLFCMSHPAPPRLRFVVCGSDALAFRLVSELVAIHNAEVTVVCDPPEEDGDPSPANVPGVRVVPAGRWDRDMCHRLNLQHIDALALVEQNDGGNVNAALVAR